MRKTDQLALIEDLRLGNTGNLEDVYKTYREEFINWLSKNYQCDMEEARDLFQYAILVFYKNAMEGKLDTLQSSIKTYLFAIGKNQVLKKAHLKSKFSYDVMDNLMDHSDSDKLDKLEYEKNLIQVHEALQSLGDSCKELIQLTYFNRLSMDEITSKMGYKNSDTTKNLKYKCVQRLKKLINRHQKVQQQ